MENFEFNKPFSPEKVEAPVVETPAAEAPVENAPIANESSNEPAKQEVAPEAPKEEKPALGTVNGAIGSTTAPVEPKPAKPAKSDKKEETVAIKSTKNVSWSEVGKVYVGINIVSKSAADKWLTRSHVSLATPEEVAKEFGK
jgi:hypothetical protein